MKKKVVFDASNDIVHISNVDSNAVFIAQKNEYKAILVANGVWVDLETMSILSHMTGSNKKDAITKANEQGCIVHQYASFYNFCSEYVGE